MIESYSGLGHMNVESGKEVNIKELVELTKDVLAFEGKLVWDMSNNPSLMGLLGSLWIYSLKLAALDWSLKQRCKKN